MRKLRQRGGFTLVELIITLGIMALAGVILVQVYLFSSVLAQKARDTDQALYLAQSLIEGYKAGRQAPEPLSYYDENWQPASDGGVYALSFELIELSGGLSQIDLKVERIQPYPMDGEDGTQLISLSAKKYEGGKP